MHNLPKCVMPSRRCGSSYWNPEVLTCVVGCRGLLPREVQLALPGKALEVCGNQVLELVQVLRVITQDRDMQAGAIRMQVREAEGKFDATVVVTETDGQLVRKLRTQAADVARSEERRVGKECRSRW